MSLELLDYNYDVKKCSMMRVIDNLAKVQKMNEKNIFDFA
jgi:hypothetical protein